MGRYSSMSGTLPRNRQAFRWWKGRTTSAKPVLKRDLRASNTLDLKSTNKERCKYALWWVKVWHRKWGGAGISSLGYALGLTLNNKTVRTSLKEFFLLCNHLVFMLHNITMGVVNGVVHEPLPWWGTAYDFLIRQTSCRRSWTASSLSVHLSSYIYFSIFLESYRCHCLFYWPPSQILLL